MSELFVLVGFNPDLETVPGYFNKLEYNFLIVCSFLMSNSGLNTSNRKTEEIIKSKPLPAMYIKNKRDGSKFIGYSLLQSLCNLIMNYNATAYFSYT